MWVMWMDEQIKLKMIFKNESNRVDLHGHMRVQDFLLLGYNRQEGGRGWGVGGQDILL